MRIRTSRKRQIAGRLRKPKKRRTRKRRIKKSEPLLKAPVIPIEAVPVTPDLVKVVETDQLQLDTSHDKGFQAGFAKGYQEGKYAGGEAIIDQMLPPDQMLPEVTVEQIIAAGISMYREHSLPLLTVEQVGDRIIHALDEQQPLSLVRLGDGELLTLAQEIVMPVETVRREGKFLEYAGVKVPDLDIRNRLAEAVLGADIVGIPRTRMPNYQPLVSPVFRAYSIPFANRQWTDSLVNYGLCQAGYLMRILRNRRVLVIGNMAEPLSAVLAGSGIAIAGMITPVNGARDAVRIVELARHYDFEIALVSAGIAAVLITEELARLTGKVAIDFGHMANAIVKGEAPITE
ncbi:GT-D fold domain-containing protein [Paenibacillus sp. YAF4_2]|uniref:GT-D fold domain-containing protein n=1 Tax=Paenibacillus sp. YAF4_2 TaxID=3233085 RepID=UPI003F997944